jgi:hypothetical protein
VIRKPRLSCIKCDTFSNPDCFYGFRESSALPCSKDLYFYETESCYTFQVSQGTIIRGCTFDSNFCKPSAVQQPLCNLCAGSACNKRAQLDQYCYECSTNSDGSSCHNEVENLRNISCGELITNENRGCFTKFDIESQSIMRGCVAHLSTDEKFRCMNDAKNCKICSDESNCNDEIELNYGMRLKTICFTFILIAILINFIF